MNKVLIYVLSLICAFCLVIALVFTAMQIVIFNESRFHKSYEENDLYDFIGVAEDDLHEITHEMMSYLNGSREDLIIFAEIRGEDQQVFEEREILHMVDVKKLFIGGFKIRNIVAIIAVALLGVLFGLNRKKAIKPLCISYLWAMGITIGAAAALGAMMIIDFNAVFLKFHLLFFDNDLWLLNINTDVLIQMLPESFFNSLALAMVGYLSVFILIPASISIGYLLWSKKKYA